MMRALCAADVGGTREEVQGGQSRDAMTQLVTVLNWAIVVRMVGDMFSFLSLWDHMQPKHWYGATLMNRA